MVDDLLNGGVPEKPSGLSKYRPTEKQVEELENIIKQVQRGNKQLVMINLDMRLQGSSRPVRVTSVCSFHHLDSCLDEDKFVLFPRLLVVNDKLRSQLSLDGDGFIASEKVLEEDGYDGVHLDGDGKLYQFDSDED